MLCVSTVAMMVIQGTQCVVCKYSSHDGNTGDTSVLCVSTVVMMVIQGTQCVVCTVAMSTDTVCCV